MYTDVSRAKKGVALVLLGAVLVAVLIVVFLVVFQRETSRRILDQMDIHLREIAQQVSVAVEAEMRRCVDDVASLAAALEATGQSMDEEALPLLRAVANQGNISHLYLVTRGGAVYSSSPEFRAEASAFRFREAALRGESGVSDLFVSEVTGEEIFAIYQPIHRDGEIVAGLLCAVALSDLSDIVSFSGFGGEGYFYLMQPDGNTILCTVHQNQFYPSVNFYEFLDRATLETDLSGSALRARTQARQSGYLTYRVGGEVRRTYYCPVEFKDWSILSVVPASVLERYSQDLYAQALALTVKVLLVCGLLYVVGALWLRSNLRRLHSAHLSALGSNQKYRLALKNAKYQMFEYDMDHFMLLDPSGEESGARPANTPMDALALVAPGGPFTPEAKSHLSRAFSSAAAGDEQVRCELERMDGTWLRLTLSAVWQPDGTHILGTVEDVTHLKGMELQYAQEEQYREAMMREAILGLSVDLADGRVLSAFQKGKPRSDGEPLPCLDQDILGRMCRATHPDFRDNIQRIFDVENLRSVHGRGVSAINEHFRLRLTGAEDYIWAALTIHFLTNPANGHPIVFTYVKNVNQEKNRTLELEHSSEHDGLTGLLNRVAFVKRTQEVLSQPQAGTQALLMMDLDGFKAINDAYGHQIGDMLLRAIAEELEGAVGADQFVGRLGGDEFVILLHGMEAAQISRTADDLRQRVELISLDECGDCVFTISIGIAFAGPGDTFDTLYPQADQHLYEAKRAGKNRVCASRP